VSKRFAILLGIYTAIGLAFAAASSGGLAIKADDIRSQPFKDADAVGSLKKGEAVEITDKKGGWLKIKAAGGSGWVRMLSVKRGAGGGSSAAGELGGLADLSTGRAGTGQITSATGVRGLGEEDLKAAKFDAAELAKAQANAASAQSAQHFAAQGKLVSRQVALLPNPQASGAGSEAPRAGRQ
jgi:uncharacterized protein YraI